MTAKKKAAAKKKPAQKPAPKSRAERMPTKTAKQRAQKAVVALHDAGGSVTHDVAALASSEQGAASASIADKVARRKVVPPLSAARDGVEQNADGSFSSTSLPLRKLDMGAAERPPLKGVRGRVVPKPTPIKPKRVAALSATGGNNAQLEGGKAQRASKYLDHGEGSAHQFEGLGWDGTRYRTLTGKVGLEMEREGAWVTIFTEDQFVCRNKWDLAHTLQHAAREKSTTLKPRPAVRARVASMATPSGRKLPTASNETMSEEERTAWKRAYVSPTCMWGEVIEGQSCKRVSQRRVVCCGGKRFADVCEQHEHAFLTTKSSKWVGCVSYALTPAGPRIEGDVRRNEVPESEAVKI